MAKTKKKVLFLCTGNSCRSQIAEGLLRHFGNEEFITFSAGLAPAKQVHPLAAKVMKEIGIDISSQKPKGVGTFLGRESINLIVTVCHRAEESCPRLWPGVAERNRLYWPLEDPQIVSGDQEEQTKVFRNVRDDLLKRIEEFLEMDVAKQ